MTKKLTSFMKSEYIPFVIASFLMCGLVVWLAILSVYCLQMQTDIVDFKETISSDNKLQDEAIKDVLSQLQQSTSMLVSGWGEWTNWNQCRSKCVDDEWNTRDQSRSRTMVCNFSDGNCEGNNTQTERRPCNDVKFAGGCASPGVDVYGLAFSSYDEVAIAICGASQIGEYLQAVRRNCNTGDDVNCSSICGSMDSECINAVHIFYIRPVLTPMPSFGTDADQGKPGLRAYNYGKANGCPFHTGCGPNFCCCRAAAGTFK